METFEVMEGHQHEQVVFCSDLSTGLRAIIAIHDTTLGPACGGTRMWPYESQGAALRDVLRLSRAMTYKSAAADLPLGGGKAVIIAGPGTQKTEALLRSFGTFVDTLGGRYLTTTDVGTTTRDLEDIRLETRHVLGLPVAAGGSGDTSIMTGLGIYMGLKACASEVWGSDSLRGKKIAIQGFGKVAFNTAHHLLKEDAHLVVSDINGSALDRARDMGLDIVGQEEIFDLDCDIFSPCALGGVLNKDTIPRLRCRVVAGAANNQLLTDEDGEDLHRRGILYAPDYIINAGGVINASAEIGVPYQPDRAREKTERIYDIVGRVIQKSKSEEIPTARAADLLAEDRIASVRGIKRIYRTTRQNA